MKIPRSIILAGLVAFAGHFSAAFGEEAAKVPVGAEQDPALDTAVVALDGAPLFQVRGMVGFSAQKRAQGIESRLVAAAENPRVSSATIVVSHLEDRSDILAAGERVASVLDVDAAAERLPRVMMADRAREHIIQAIDRYRQERSAPVLVRRTVKAAAATAVFVLLLLGIGRLYRFALSVAERHLKTRMDSLEKRSASVIESRPLWTAIRGVLSGIRVVGVVVLIYFYLNLALGLYPWTRPFAGRLFAVLTAPLRDLKNGFVAAIPDLAFLIIFSLVIRYVLKITHMFFNAIEQGTIVIADFEKDWAIPTHRIARFLILCFAVVVAYPYIPGSNSDAFKGVSLFVGILFSLGSTSVIANLVGSVALTYRRAFKVGHIIRINDILGRVIEMRIQATHLRTRHNETVVIPNSTVVNSHIINYSLMAKTEGLILNTTVGIGYETPWRQVEAMLLDAAGRTPGLLAEPKAFVRQKLLDTFCVQYELNVYCDEPHTMPQLYSALHGNIQDVFNEHGVQIMTPAYEGDPEKPKVVPKERWHEPPALPKS